MKKIIYWFGVYSLCVITHETIQCVVNDHRNKRVNKKEEPIGIRPKPAKDTINMIGFGDRV